MYRSTQILIILAASLISSCTLPFTFHINETQVLSESSLGFPTGLPITTLTVSTPGASNESATSPIPTATPPASGVTYRIQFGTPLAIKNFIHPDAGCNWLGVGGQAFNQIGEPATALIAEVGGSLAGQNIDQISITGSSLDFGPAGYEVKLGNSPVASKGTLWVQLLDLNGVPQSSKIYFETYKSCEQNLILINFTAVNLSPRTVYLPFVGSRRTTVYIPLIEKRYASH